jgi:hypothetical protein
MSIVLFHFPAVRLSATHDFALNKKRNTEG